MTSKPDITSFLGKLLHEHYRRHWEIEREYRINSQDFAAAIISLRRRTGLSQSQFVAICPGNTVAFSNIKNLELKGTPMHPDVCNALRTVALEYGLIDIAVFFARCSRHQTHGPTRKGRRYKMESNRTW